jgi:pilus assembly protein CpaC
MTRLLSGWRGLAVLVALLAGGAAPAARAAELLNMPAGSQRVLTMAAPVTRIVIAQEGVIDAGVYNDRDVQVTGLKPGRTSLVVFTAGSPTGAEYLVTVGGGLAPVSTGAPAADAAAVTRLLKTQPGMADVHAQTQGGNVVLTGSVGDLETHARAVAAAQAAGGGKVADLLNVGGDQMVAVDIRFAAVEATTLQSLGFNFQRLGNGIQGALTGPSTVQSFSFGAGISALTTALPISSAFNLLIGDTGSNLGAALSVLSQAGLTQMLAEPTLLVKSGSTADFMAGGEIPIPVPQGGSSSGTITIEYHPYGVRLSIAPVVLSDRRILLRVSPEVSEIDTSNALSLQGYNVPAFRKRSTSTTVELGDGQSFVLAGLIFNSSAVTESKIPGLGDLPIIGAFFKQTQNSRDRQELIVIATPHLVHPLDGGRLPPLPGERTAAYNPSVLNMLLNNKPLDRTLVQYGLMK